MLAKRLFHISYASITYALAVLIAFALTLSSLIVLTTIYPYLTGGEEPRAPVPVAVEGIAPAWHWQFAVPVTASVEVEGEGKVGDPWGASVGWIYSISLPGCILPNRQTSSVSSNATHYNYVCSFIPNVQTGSSIVIPTHHVDPVQSIVEISWQSLDTSRIYRYLMVWQRGIVTTFAENALSRIRVEQHILPQFLNVTSLPDRSQTCSWSDQIVLRGPGGTQIPTTSYSFTTAAHRINATHQYARLVISFSQAAQIQQIEWIRARGNCQWATDFVIMRVTFVDAANNVRTINVSPGDTLVFDRVLILRQR